MASVVLSYIGVVLTVQPTEDISEFSNMTRPLCVELTEFGDGLERDVFVDLQFLQEGYATHGIYHIQTIVCMH